MPAGTNVIKNIPVSLVIGKTLEVINHLPNIAKPTIYTNKKI
jgi:hypothetical protein